MKIITPSQVDTPEDYALTAQMEDAYVTGWNDSTRYWRERRELQKSVGCGLPFIMFGLLIAVSIGVQPLNIDGPVAWDWVLGIVGFGIALAIAGFFLNRRDRKHHEEDVADFNRRWKKDWTPE